MHAQLTAASLKAVQACQPNQHQQQQKQQKRAGAPASANTREGQAPPPQSALQGGPLAPPVLSPFSLSSVPATSPMALGAVVHVEPLSGNNARGAPPSSSETFALSTSSSDSDASFCLDGDDYRGDGLYDSMTQPTLQVSAPSTAQPSSCESSAAVHNQSTLPPLPGSRSGSDRSSNHSAMAHTPRTTKKQQPAPSLMPAPARVLPAIHRGGGGHHGFAPVAHAASTDASSDDLDSSFNL